MSQISLPCVWRLFKLDAYESPAAASTAVRRDGLCSYELWGLEKDQWKLVNAA